MPRQITFYTKKEEQELISIRQLKGETRNAKLRQFCKDYGRNYYGAKAKMYYLTQKSKTQEKIEKQPKKIATVSTSEFIIPVKKYELREIDGQLNIVIKF